MAKWLNGWCNFWKRLKGANDEYMDILGSRDSEPEDTPPTTRRSWLTRWTPGAQRERQIAWLRAGYSEMLNLIRSIQSHLDRQEDIQQKLVGALEKLPTSLDGLQSLGKAAEQQVEALHLLREQLARSGHHDQQLAESMSRFDQTLGLLNETARSSGKTAEDLVQQAREEDRMLHELVQRFEKRYLLVTVFFVLALFALVSAAFYSFYRLEQAMKAQPSAAATLVSAAEPAIHTTQPAAAIQLEKDDTESLATVEQPTQPVINATTTTGAESVSAPEAEAAAVFAPQASVDQPAAPPTTLVLESNASADRTEKKTRRWIGRRKTTTSQRKNDSTMPRGEEP